MDTKYDLKYWKKHCPEVNCKKACDAGIGLVLIPAALGDDSPNSEVAPKNGAYCNVLVKYETNGHLYLYGKDGSYMRLSTSGIEEFDELIGRPKYNGVEMTSETDIPNVTSAVAGEAALRVAADEHLQQEIDDIKNSPDVVDIVATYAALQAYDTSHLGNNDIIRVLADETHDGQSTYYRWNKQSHTWTYIGAVGDYYTKGQVDNLLSGKQNTLTAGTGINIASDTISVDTSEVQAKLTAGDNITISGNEISATDTKYTAGTGLDLTGTEFSIDSNTVQGKLTAGNNITIGNNNEISATDTTYTAGANISISAQNEISATDTTYSAFTGTDGTATGTSGLVPAPATTDAGKYLKADGTWEIVQAGGGIKVLSTDDYNWNKVAGNNTTTPFDSVALWLLDNNIYYAPYSLRANVLYTPSHTINREQTTFAISDQDGYIKVINVINGTSDDALTAWTVDATSGQVYDENYQLRSNMVIDNLTSTSTTGPLSAKQGKVLKDLIDSLVIKGAGAPTTSTVGTVGKLYEDTTNGKLYICTAIVPGTAPDPDTYTWEEVGSGGGQFIPLTTADYPSGSNQIRAWLLEPGFYINADSVNLAFAPCNTVGTSLLPGKVFYVGGSDYAGYKDVTILSASTGMTWDWYTVNASTGVAMFQYHIPKNVVDNLTSTSTTEALTANQGRILKNTIDGIAITGAGAPTTSTAGTVGKLYEDTTNGDLYICTDATNPYVWEEVGAGGSSIATFTSNEWNALWA